MLTLVFILVLFALTPVLFFVMNTAVGILWSYLIFLRSTQTIHSPLNTKQIAQLLDTSVKTIESHRASLMERLDIHDIAGLVRYAVRNGLVSSDK